MKRTKEGYFREHPEWEKVEGISGVKELDGEDLGFIIILFKKKLYLLNYIFFFYQFL